MEKAVPTPKQDSDKDVHVLRLNVWLWSGDYSDNKSAA